MTLASLRNLLRRRLHDDPGTGEGTAHWTDADLNEIINLAYQQEQKEIIKIAPEATLKRVTTDILAGENLYPKPADMWFEISFGYIATDYASGYRPMTKSRFASIDAQTVGVTGEVQYGHFGQNFIITPTPTTTLANGLRLSYVPILSVEDDSDVFAIPVPLHYAILIWADIIAKGETHEEVAGLYTALGKVNDDLSSYYFSHGQVPDTLELDIDNGEGVRPNATGMLGISPGRYHR
jgi:hypothetical protein